MCGRYGLQTPTRDLARQLDAVDRTEATGPRYNVAPTQRMPICRQPEGGERELVSLEWGLIPFWSLDPHQTRSQYSLINARAESVADKPAFKAAFRYRRCLVPADGFFEWQAHSGGPKQPYWIRFAGGEPMYFAGIWEHWEGEVAGEPASVESYCIIVGEPNELVAPIHNRMPVILSPSDWPVWLDPGVRDGEMLGRLLGPRSAEGMEAVPVGRRVNNPQHDDPGVLERAE